MCILHPSNTPDEYNCQRRPAMINFLSFRASKHGSKFCFHFYYSEKLFSLKNSLQSSHTLEYKNTQKTVSINITFEAMVGLFQFIFSISKERNEIGCSLSATKLRNHAYVRLKSCRISPEGGTMQCSLFPSWFDAVPGEVESAAVWGDCVSCFGGRW